MTNIAFGEDGRGETPAMPGRVYPLRRLGLSEVLGGGFSLIRHAPKAVLGVPFAAGLASFLASLLVFVVLPESNFFRMIYDPMAFEEPGVAVGAFAEWTFLVTVLVIGILQNIVLSIGYALVVIPSLRAAYGFRTGFGQTFSIAAGRLGPLVLLILVMAVLVTVITVVTAGVVVGLLVLVGVGVGPLPAVLLGLAMIPAVLLLIVWLIVGFMYAPMVVLVEQRGPLEAIARSWALNKGLWWRNIGTLALIMLLMIMVMSVLTMPMSLLTGLGLSTAWMSEDPEIGNLLSFALLAGTTFLDSALTAVLLGIGAAMIVLIYVNCRVRWESLDVALLTAAEHAVDDGKMVPGSAMHLGELRSVPQGPQNAYGNHAFYGTSYGAGQYGTAPYREHPGAGQHGADPHGQRQPPPGHSWPNPYGHPTGGQTSGGQEVDAGEQRPPQWGPHSGGQPNPGESSGPGQGWDGTGPTEPGPRP